MQVTNTHEQPDAVQTPKRQRRDSGPSLDDLAELFQTISKELESIRPVAILEEATVFADRITFKWRPIEYYPITTLIKAFLGPWKYDWGYVWLSNFDWVAIRSCLEHHPQLFLRFHIGLQQIHHAARAFKANVAEGTWPTDTTRNKFLLLGTVYLSKEPRVNKGKGIAVDKPICSTWVTTMEWYARMRFPRPDEKGASVWYTTLIASNIVVTGTAENGREFNYAAFSMDPSAPTEGWAVYYRPDFALGVFMDAMGKILVFLTDQEPVEKVEAGTQLPPIRACWLWFGTRLSLASVEVQEITKSLGLLNLSTGNWTVGQGKCNSFWLQQKSLATQEDN